jgi:hypothetical protein
MPFTGDIPQMVDTIILTLGMLLERWDFPSKMSGSED